MRGEIRQNDVGTTLILTIKDQDGTVVDISTASAKKIVFRKPDGTASLKDAAFTTDGTDGKIEYTTVTDFLDQVGEWQMQGKVTVSTSIWKSDIQKFQVYSNLAES